MEQYLGHYSSPLGPMTMAGTDAALTGLWFDGQKYFGAGLSEQYAEVVLPGADPEAAIEESAYVPATEGALTVFDLTARWLDVYFSGEDPASCGCALPLLAPAGSPFRKAVWEILLTIPYGHTMTYGEIAERLRSEHDPAAEDSSAAGAEREQATRQSGRPVQTGMLARAVGGAVGHNPVSVIIPCHRVLGSGGKLTGYAGGIEKKIRLLELEGISGWK